MLSLSNLTPFGIGGRRLCFSQPTDKGKCVKVLRIDEQRTVRIKKLRLLPAFMHRAYNNNAHEKKILSGERSIKIALETGLFNSQSN